MLKRKHIVIFLVSIVLVSALIAIAQRLSKQFAVFPNTVSDLDLINVAPPIDIIGAQMFLSEYSDVDLLLQDKGGKKLWINNPKNAPDSILVGDTRRAIDVCGPEGKALRGLLSKWREDHPDSNDKIIAELFIDKMADKCGHHP